MHVERGGADLETPQEPPAPLVSLSDGLGGAEHPLVVVGASSRGRSARRRTRAMAGELTPDGAPLEVPRVEA